MIPVLYFLIYFVLSPQFIVVYRKVNDIFSPLLLSEWTPMEKGGTKGGL